MPAVRIKDHWREQRLFDQRSLICAVLMALATLGLLARLFVLQVNRHDYYESSPRATAYGPSRSRRPAG